MEPALKKSKAAAGLIFFILVNASFVFLLLSPWIENPLGKYLDNRLLSGLDARMEKVRKGDFTVTLLNSDGVPLRNYKVSYDMTGHDFIFGSLLEDFNEPGNPGYAELYQNYFKSLFNLAVLHFAWPRYEPVRGEFPLKERFAESIAWCEQNGIAVKGHPLAWRNPAGYPVWLPDDDGKVIELLQVRIQGTIRDYRDHIHIWDVVNEPTHYYAFGHQSYFDYVNNALTWADEADPRAFFCVNEFGILGHDFGYGPFYRLIKNLRAHHAHLNAIGFQGHEPRTDWIPLYEIEATLNAYARLGLPIYITEAIVPGSSLPITNSWKKGVWDEQAQAEYVERYYRLLFSHPAVEGIIYWGLLDKTAWVTDGCLLTRDMQPKESFKRLSHLITEEWHTRGEGTTDSSGTLHFRGFYGTYELTIPELSRKYTIKTTRRGENKSVVKVQY